MSSGVGLSTFDSLADPPGASVLLPAVSWLEGTLLGTIATLAATIAIASIGYMMITGRLGVRPGVAVLVGSFILLGASTIAAGIQASAAVAGAPVASYMPPPPPPTSAPPQPASAPPQAAYDPHAGASVPEP